MIRRIFNGIVVTVAIVAIGAALVIAILAGAAIQERR